jgi:hypothetical protein
MGWVQIGAKSTQDVTGLVGRRVRVRMPCDSHGFRGADEPFGPAVDLALGRTGFVAAPHHDFVKGTLWVVLAMLEPPEPAGLTWAKFTKNPTFVRHVPVAVDVFNFRTRFQIEG